MLEVQQENETKNNANTQTTRTTTKKNFIYDLENNLCKEIIYILLLLLLLLLLLFKRE